MKIPWSFPQSLKVLALIAGALLASTAFPEDPPPDDEDLILGGIILTYPLITPTQTGTLNYTADGGTVGTFVVNSLPQAVNYSAGPNNFQTPPTPALTMQFGVDKSSCIIDPGTGQARNCLISPNATNTFQITGKLLGPDGVTVLDGALLSGTVLEFGFSYTGAGTDFFDMRVHVTGGLIASQVIGDLGVKIQAELSTFAGKFTQNFAASPVKPDVGSIRPLLGDRVWNDQNGNGIEDCTYAPGSLITTSSRIPTPYDTNCEPGISGVKVYLVDCNNPNTILATATTSSSGFYSFTSPTIQPAPTGTSYCVKFDPSSVPNYCTSKYPTGPGGTLKFTKQFVGGPITDSNANPATGVAPPVTLLPSEINRSVDAGLYCPSALGDTVWNDTNKNGVQDSLNQPNGEQGINDLTVQLYDCSNHLLNTTTTGPAPANASSPQVAGGPGWYGFSDLTPGCYQVKFTPPADYAFSLQYQGGNIVLDSNPNPDGITDQINLASGEYKPTIDAGVYELPPLLNSSLGNFFWHDLNANGIQDANEPGINGVQVTLRDGNCQNPSTTATTAGGGIYNFTSLAAGNYCVQFGKPANFCQFGSSSTPSFSPKNVPGSTAANDSDTNLTTGLTDTITLPPNTDDLTWDAGVYCPAKVGNFVWQDCNQNGLQDDAIIPGCTYGGGYPNVTVRLRDCSGNLVTDLNGNSSVTTAANGGYSFLVNPGSYIVEFVKPNGTVFTTPYVGSNPAIDSDANPTTGRTACTMVPSNTNNDTLDAGVYTPTTPNVTLVKFTNGYDGNNAFDSPVMTPPNGPLTAGDNQVAVVTPGATVTWTYQVKNTGNEPLANLVVTDPLATAQGATIDCGNGTNTLASLAVNAVATCTATAPAQLLAYGPNYVQQGCSDGNNTPNPTYENTGTVTANGQYSGTAVKADDRSHYCNPNPAVKLVKYTNGWDANDLNGNPTPSHGSFAPDDNPVPQVAPGSTVTWTYRMTNTGNIALQNLTVTDSVLPAATIDCGNGTNTLVSLAVDAAVDCTATALAPQLTASMSSVRAGCGSGSINTRPTYENLGTVTGTGTDGTPVQSSDLSHYCNPLIPRVKLVKYTNGWDGDTLNGVPQVGTGPFMPGGDGVAQVTANDPVTWTYQVTNTGDELLTNVTVTDSVLPATAINCGNNSNVIASLAVGAAVDCTATALAPQLAYGPTYVKAGCGSGSTSTRPTYENTGYVSATGQYSGTAVNDSNVSHYCNGLDLPKPGSYTLTKTPKNATYSIGQNINFTMVVTSTGPGTAQNVVLNDPLPTLGNLNTWTITSNPGGCSITGNTLTCSFGDLANGQTRSITVATNAAGGANATACPGGVKLNNTATVTGTGLTPLTDTGDYTCTPPSNNPAIRIKKATNAVDPLHPTAAEEADTPPGQAIPTGTPIVWTYRVSNPGTVPLSNLTVIDDNGTPGNPADNFTPAPVLSAGFNVGDTNKNGLLDTNELWLYTSAGVKTVTAGVNMPLSLGQAAGYGILGLNNGSVSINSNTSFIGDIGYSQGVTSTINQKIGSSPLATSSWQGTAYVHSNVATFTYSAKDYLPSGGIVQGDATQSARLDQANQDALALSSLAANLPTTIDLGDLPDSTPATLTIGATDGKATTNVVRIGSLNFNGVHKITLVGDTSDYFIVNVMGDFQFSQSVIELSGGLTVSHVLWNFPTAGTQTQNVLINKSATIWNGTILAPDLDGFAVVYHNPAQFNGAIIAKNVTVHSDFNLKRVPFEPATVYTNVGTVTGKNVYSPYQTVTSADPSSYHTVDICTTGVIGGVNLGGIVNNELFLFANGSVDANWQGATKGFVGNVVVDGIQAAERTSGGVPYAGTIYTNDSTLGAWQNIVNQNAGQAFASFGNVALVSAQEAKLIAAFQQLNGLAVTSGYSNRSATSLNGLNTQNGIAETFVINVTSGFQVSSKINITGDAGDVFILRWDTDQNFSNGYQGQVKFQSGGAIVPLGGLKPGNFIHVAGDINASGGGSNPVAPYPQGPRLNNGTGALIGGASNFSGGGFFTGYWLTTGAPTNYDPVSGLYYGNTASLSNGIFVGGWYTLTNKFSMTSGTSGVYVSPKCE